MEQFPRFGVVWRVLIEQERVRVERSDGEHRWRYYKGFSDRRQVSERLVLAHFLLLYCTREVLLLSSIYTVSTMFPGRWVLFDLVYC